MIYKGRGESKARVPESRQQGMKKEMRMMSMRTNVRQREKCEQKLEGVNDAVDLRHRKELIHCADGTAPREAVAGMQGSDYEQSLQRQSWVRALPSSQAAHPLCVQLQERPQGPGSVAGRGLTRTLGPPGTPLPAKHPAAHPRASCARHAGLQSWAPRSSSKPSACSALEASVSSQLSPSLLALRENCPPPGVCFPILPPQTARKEREESHCFSRFPHCCFGPFFFHHPSVI